MTPELRARFSDLHAGGCFVLPNAWDVGSAKLLQRAGALAVATTSSGFAAALGRHDETVTLPELLTHVHALTTALSVPQLAAAGVRRVSTGGSLVFAAYATLDRIARGLLDEGTADFDVLSADGRRAFD
ncbi:hypothetical protein CGZ93_01160 [Enemella dayhoffiae]|uniref:Isocitrate lyase/phosphoenolpyruvate mutase family protein n=1 Tax=Enemella dayhoffiae TaxID=2016507 RepID=A0A255HBP8_9ACTN|nr:isocitrate lyase/phosphoenolpyruvate mutase family protein [Enemella dayhoffiae]OYO25099.1 hypothetical protein CGZ93_01160 [Enemella dayhoffiae]